MLVELLLDQRVDDAVGRHPATVFDVVKRKARLVPSVMAASACSTLIVPPTPGDVMAPIEGDEGTSMRPVAASNAAAIVLSGPAGILKVFDSWAATRSCAASAAERRFVAMRVLDGLCRAS